jgi:hypothetical protein
MKMLLSSLTLFLALCTSVAVARPVEINDEQRKRVEQNVLANLKHPSLEVRAGTMQLLIDLKTEDPSYSTSYAFSSLVEMLQNHEEPEFRMLAALTLFHLDSDRGRIALERRARSDKSERVANYCQALIDSWHKKNMFSTDLLAQIMNDN